MNLGLPAGRNRGESLTMNRNSARSEEVRVLQHEVLSWMSKTLGKQVQLKDVVVGVDLCKLLLKVKEMAPSIDFGRVRVRGNASSSPFLAIENIQTFLNAGTRIGVPNILLIDPIELTQLRRAYAPRKFLLFVLVLARKCYEEHGIEPPDIVKAEIEIDELRRQAMERLKSAKEEDARDEEERRRREAEKKARLKAELALAARAKLNKSPQEYELYEVVESDPVDVKIGKLVNDMQLPIQPVRVTEGEYIINDKTVYIRTLHDQPLVFAEGVGTVRNLNTFLAKQMVSQMNSIASVAESAQFKQAVEEDSDQAMVIGSDSIAQQLALTVDDDDDDAEDAEDEEDEEDNDKLVHPTFKGHARSKTVTESKRKEVVSKEIQELLDLINQIKKPLDPAALQLGGRWFTRSGAQHKKMSASVHGTSYQSYLTTLLNTPDAQADYRQISLDIDSGRTTGHVYSTPRLQEFLHELELMDKDVQKKLKSILTACVSRNPHVGYAQGMNDVAYLLLTVMPEEEAFWTMCAMVEDLRSPDFYSRTPPTMNGFQCSSKVLGNLAASSFPQLVDALESESNVASVAQLGALKWWINCFVDSVPFDSMLCILDYFFHCPPDTVLSPRIPKNRSTGALTEVDDSKKRPDSADLGIDLSLAGGDVALLRSSLTIMEASQDAILDGSDALPTVLATARSIPAETILRGMSDRWFSPQQLMTLQRQIRQNIESDWNRLVTQFRLLADAVRFTADLLDQLLEIYLQHHPDMPDLITREELETILTEGGVTLTDDTRRWLYKIHDPQNTGKVDFRDIYCCFATLSEGSVVDRLQRCYDMFALSNKGMLTPSGVDQLSASLQKLIKRGQKDLVRTETGTNLLAKEDYKLVPYEEATLPMLTWEGTNDLVPFQDFNDWINTQPHLIQCFLVTDAPPKQMLMIEGPKKKVHKAPRACCTICGISCCSGRQCAGCNQCVSVRSTSHEDGYEQVQDETEDAEEESSCALM